MSLIEYHDAFPLHLSRDDLGDLGVQKILIAVDHHIGIVDHVPGEEVGTPSPLLTEGPQVLERVHAGRKKDSFGAPRGRPIVGLEERTGGDGPGGRLGGAGADPTGGQAAAGGVDGVAGGGGDDAGINAEVLPGAEPKGEEASPWREEVIEEAELGEGLLHFVDSPRAVDELKRLLWLGEDVADDEREQRHRLAGAGGHLQKAMPPGIEGPLHLHHVLVLLRIDVLVGEVHRHVVDLEPHGGGRHLRSPAAPPLPLQISSAQQLWPF